MTLACLRHGLAASYGKGARHLPCEVLGTLATAVVRSLDHDELTRALAAAVDGFLTEVDAADAPAAARLRPVLREALHDSSWRG